MTSTVSRVASRLGGSGKVAAGIFSSRVAGLAREIAVAAFLGNGAALDFDGNDDSVDVGINAFDLGIRRHATFAAWVSIDDVTATLDDVISDWNTDNGMTLRVDGNDLVFYVYPNDHRITAANVVTAGWHRAHGSSTNTEMGSPTYHSSN